MNAYFNEWPRFQARLPVKELIPFRRTLTVLRLP